MERRESKADESRYGTARHAITCPTCKPKAARILATADHIERWELLAQIELHEQQQAGRRLHA